MSEQTLPVLEELHDKLMMAFECEESAGQTTVRRTIAPSTHARKPIRFAADHLPVPSLRFRRAALAAAACAIAVCAVVFAWPGPDRGPLKTEQALAEVAQGAVSSALPFAEDDQFTYTHSKDTWGTSFLGGSGGPGRPPAKSWTAMQDVDRRVWASAYRNGVIVEKRSEFHFYTARDRRRAEASNLKDLASHNDIGSPGRHVMGLGANRGYFMDADSGKLTRAELLAYPTDPETIYRRVLKGLNGAGQGPADGVWQLLTESLYGSSLPPALRAGMVRALGLIPGVESLGERTDPLGRVGVAFGRVHNDVRDEVLFNPETSQMLYMQSVMLKPGAKDRRGWPAGTVVGRSLQYEQRVVDQPPAKYERQMKAKRSRRP